MKQIPTSHRYMQGQFKPMHPEKYRGNPAQIIYRSSWELAVLMRLDSNKNVIEWASEELCIPYQDQSSKDSNGNFALRRYFPDFWVRYRDHANKIRTMIIEVKPAKETKPPSPKAKRAIKEMKTFVRNQCKWQAAQTFCQAREWEFKVLTEADLGLAFLA